MRFLVDAQLPKRLSLFSEKQEFDSKHTLDLPEQSNSTDQFIINFTQEQNRVVISKDDDFLQSQLIKKKPNKLILIKTSSIRNTTSIELIRKNLSTVLMAIESNNLVKITNTDVIAKN
ncbi:MAG: DUF5615 family PIN-like protein [Vicingaceae bacterium]|jgi:predicted nuclease of predicted toxin-antitoxin system